MRLSMKLIAFYLSGEESTNLSKGIHFFQFIINLLLHVYHNQ